MTSRGDARLRITLYFLLGIAVPSGLLGYLAFRGIQNDRALVERERRNRLEAVGFRFDSAVEARLADAGAAVAAAAPEGLRRLVRERSDVEAVFDVDAAGVRMVAAEGAVFARVGRPAPSGGADAADALLRRARDLELRGRDPEGALALYERVASGPATERSRAEALAGAARVHRKLGRPAAASEAYARLGSELGDVPSPAGIPYGAAASLERAALLVETGDTAAAAEALLALHRDLVDGRWTLTRVGFDMLTASAREALDGLAGPSSPALSERARAAVAAEAAARERALRLAAFEEAAAGIWRDAAPGPSRAAVEAGGRSFAAALVPPGAAVADAPRRGFVVDVDALAADGLDAVLGADRGRVAWVLRGPDGSVLEASAASPAPRSSPVRVTVPGFAPWSLELAPSASAVDGGFLTSRRAIYFYAFVLLAGILLFGLTLTIRTVGRELELARLQSDFVSTVSHELKSPLTAIRQLAEMLQADRVPSEERRRRYYDVLVEQSERLSRLVDNVLDFARMEAGRREMAFEPVDPGALVEDVVSDVRRRVAHEGFTVRSEIDGPLPLVPLDAEAVRQALANLVDNGVKYSGDARDVLVRGFRENGEVVLAVEDRGVGMAPDETARIFERFYRGGDPMTRSVKGTGLGLTLVKQIVDAHGGRVEVRSEPGHGSTFAIRLPVGTGPGARGREG